MRNNKLFLIIFIITFLFLVDNVVYSQGLLKVGEITVKPGEKKSGFIIVPAKGDEPEIKIPVTVVNGLEKGPVLALTAGVHGYEYPPILALQRLRRKLEPSKISGAVIMVHVTNIPAFLKRMIYYNPYDWKNLNRVFPGKIDGTMCERIAYQITKEVIDRCDYLIDMHCGDGNEDLTPYLYCTEIGDEKVDKLTRELAINFGFKVIVLESNRPKNKEASIYCANTALLRGKPAITIESGKLGRTDKEDVDRIIKGAFNILKYLKMIEGKPDLICEPVWVRRLTIIRSEHNGIFYPLVYRGKHVKKGELLGYLTDFFGNIIQKVKAPYNGMIMYIIATPPMSKGEPMVSVGGF